MKKTVLAICPATPFKNIIDEVRLGLNNDIRQGTYNNLHIIQIGAGGTGGYVAYEILRMLGNMPQELKPHVHYTLMDGDVYEPKNLGRQLCCEDDMGKFKAQVLVEDYGELFGITKEQATYVPEYLTNISQLQNLEGMSLPYFVSFGDKEREHFFTDAANEVVFGSNQPHRNVGGISYIIIDCVDKNAPRKIIQDYLNDCNIMPGMKEKVNYAAAGFAASKLTLQGELIKEQDDRIVCGTYGITPVRDIYVISSGNGKYTGQVSWGRKVFLGNSTGPMHYQDIYGDREVSSIIGPKIEAMSDAYELPKDISQQELNQLKLKVMASEYYNAETVRALLSGNLKQLQDPESGIYSTHGYIISLPVPVTTGEDKVLNVEHPMMRNINMFMSAFMSTPTPYDRFPALLDLEEDAREEAMSCAERAEHNVQSINANKTAAALVINYFTMIFNGMYPLEKEVPVLTTETTRFNILTGEYSSDPITTESLCIPRSPGERVAGD